MNENTHRLSFLSQFFFWAAISKSSEAYSSFTVPKFCSSYSQPSFAPLASQKMDISSKDQSEEVANALFEVSALLKPNYEEETPTAEEELV